MCNVRYTTWSMAPAYLSKILVIYESGKILRSSGSSLFKPVEQPSREDKLKTLIFKI